MIPVLLGAAHYYYHLSRSSLISKTIQKYTVTQVEFFKLGSSDQVNLLSSRLCGENLLKDGIITLPDEVGFDDIFSIRITNASGRDFYPSIFYFNNRALSISESSLYSTTVFSLTPTCSTIFRIWRSIAVRSRLTFAKEWRHVELDSPWPGDGWWILKMLLCNFAG
jgi:hypothetical protein